MNKYEEQKFNLVNLKGLSEKQVTEHIKLYGGYVKNTNNLTDKMAELKINSEANALALSELTRRFGFEWNGMRLHELYFDCLDGAGQTAEEGNLKMMIEAQYGSFDNWLHEFKSVGLMRGIGWVILYYDPIVKRLQNVWIADHEVGHLASLPIILAMDVWEHAYLLDYLPSQRKEYIEAFFQNLNWRKLNERLHLG
ncbi:MAG: Fe-Mn family superoxide dismutase [bacterium]|nr:Fe-Mn family superoxide dismutase [bacterium]